MFPEWLGTPSKTTPRTTDVISRIRFVDAVSQYFLFLPPQTGTTLLSPIRQSSSSFASPVSFSARSVSLSHTHNLYLCFSISSKPSSPPPTTESGLDSLQSGSPCSFNFSRSTRARTRTHAQTRESLERELRALASCVSPLCHHPPSLFHLKRRPIICSVLRQTAATTKCKKSYEGSERWNRPSWLT